MIKGVKHMSVIDGTTSTNRASGSGEFATSVRPSGNKRLYEAGQSGSDRGAAAVIFGRLVKVEAAGPFADTRNVGGPDRYVHTLLLDRPGGLQWKCSVYDTRVLDFEPQIGEAISLEVSYFKRDDYGRPLVRGGNESYVCVCTVPVGTPERLS
jgi:hypothetical protein